MAMTGEPICSGNHISRVEFYLMISIIFVDDVEEVVVVDGVEGGVFQKKLLGQDHYFLSALFHGEYQML